MTAHPNRSSIGNATPAPLQVVIIGGGINGAAIARDAALRGVDVVLFEKGDFGSGASSKTSKLAQAALNGCPP